MSTEADTASLAATARMPVIDLPMPRRDFGVSLARALKLRRSIRDFSTHPIPPLVLSELLWCAYGINRPATGDRTAPSWRHALETEIFAVMQAGVWRYEPAGHRLVPHLAMDVRKQTGLQDFPGTAPLDLVYVSHADHLHDASPEEQRRVAAADTGFIGQNVYLYCASEELACVFRGAFDAAKLAETLKLPPTQFITFVQTVGYPAKG